MIDWINNHPLIDFAVFFVLLAFTVGMDKDAHL